MRLGMVDDMVDLCEPMSQTPRMLVRAFMSLAGQR